MLLALASLAPLVGSPSVPSPGAALLPEPTRPPAASSTSSSRALGVPKEVSASFKKGISILLDMQESMEDGDKREWPYEGVYRERGQIPIGYRVGGTSICAWALLDTPSKKNVRAERAVQRALEFVLESLDGDPNMSAGFSRSYDVRGWGHAYALNFLLRLRELERVPNKHVDAVDDAILWLIETIEETEIVDTGGWNYSRRKGGDEPASASTFMTASTLQALFAARAQDEFVDEDVIARGLDRIEEARLQNDAFQYASSKNEARRKTEGFNHAAGSTGRSPVCEVTLLLAGRGDVDRVRGALDDFFEHWQFLEDRRRQTGTHIGPYKIAPYYFFYAHYYAAQAIEMLPESERPEWRARLRERFFEVRDGERGGWNDRVFERSENFGTAMTLLAFSRPLLDGPAGWPVEASAERANGKAEEASSER